MEELIWNEVQAAAKEAYNNCIPVPMVIGRAASLFGNEIVPGTEEVVDDGVCGFAWVIIKPARGKFVSFLKKNLIGDRHIYGGWIISAYEITKYSTQSMQKKEAACRAAVEILRNYGIQAFMQSRMD